jgi:nickel-type superoxide dismutase maturation protease
MLRIIRVVGESMSPEITDGDYVAMVTSPRFLHRLRPGDVIVFRHPIWGRLIKRIARHEPGLGYYVIGANSESLDSRKLGYIPQEAIEGKVIWHIRQH